MFDSVKLIAVRNHSFSNLNKIIFFFCCCQTLEKLLEKNYPEEISREVNQLIDYINSPVYEFEEIVFFEMLSFQSQHRSSSDSVNSSCRTSLFPECMKNCFFEFKFRVSFFQIPVMKWINWIVHKFDYCELNCIFFSWSFENKSSIS